MLIPQRGVVVMGIRSYIWDSWATTFQPNRFQLYSLLFFYPENLSFFQSDAHNLGVATCLPISEIHGPKLVELTQSVTATFRSDLLGKAEPLGTLPATCRLNFPVAHGGQACCVCALFAEGSCHICDENLCGRHIYQCPECQISFCGDCFDLHGTEGHWSDSDTVAALADSSCRRLEGECSAVILPKDITKKTSSVSAILTIATSLSTACCNSTLDKTLYLPPFQGLFSIFTAIPAEAGR